MKTLVLTAPLLLATPVHAQAPSDGLATFLKAKMRKERIPTVQVAVVRRGKIVTSTAYGIADVEHDVPATPSSIFSINSCTKAFTGVAIMQLSEAGKLQIDDPVSTYRDDLPPSWRAITIRQVLSHVSGLPNIIDEKEQVIGDGTTAGTNELLNGSGLGWPVTMRSDHPAAGPIGGMRSAFFVYPKDDLSVVVLTNLQGANPEYFIDEVAAYHIPGMHEADGFGLPSAVKAFRSVLLRRGFQHAPRVLHAMRTQPSESELNAWGYKLREQGQPEQALAIFRLNVADHPGSWNAHDSLAEALEASGDRAGAITHYRQSLKLNAGNGNAVERLGVLEPAGARSK